MPGPATGKGAFGHYCRGAASKVAGLKGGLGKTVLAKALLRDSEIAAAYGGERYWCVLGRTTDPREVQRQLLRDLTGQPAVIETISDGQAQLRQALAGRRCLIVLDDIWTTEQASAFAELGDSAVFVVTTRFQTVLAKLGAEAQALDQLDAAQGRELLAAWAKASPGQLPDIADAIVEECGFLPLAISCFGAAIASDRINWQDGLEALLVHDLGDLEAEIEGYDGNAGMFGAIDLSFRTLDQEDAIALARCAIIPEDAEIPIEALSALWHDLPVLGQDPRQVRRLCNRLVDTSLLIRDVAAGGEARWKLHDLVCDYLRGRLKEPRPIHGAIVSGYRATSGADWLPQEDDGYFHDWFAFHLAQAGRGSELREMVFDLFWMQAKLRHRDVQALIADLRLLDADEATGLLVRVLRMSAHVLNEFPEQPPASRGGIRPRSATNALPAGIPATRHGSIASSQPVQSTKLSSWISARSAPRRCSPVMAATQPAAAGTI
ncbi:NB-ARC domain-containing protein [Paracoccus sp. MBLB3053]|uniref:NB-ARC domain-containing protein n=1 Tax=Paracoccus aurantius TaxID=3073814 RepID=A0ABU2HPV5_9RHOB|nr:NB-ARC domain-containing protein [Paracoccus sp. MBLB3053]MDS9467080.1 NB-ARC domain-containing protein [Paracoccus sp. MBLB3053]